MRRLISDQTFHARYLTSNLLLFSPTKHFSDSKQQQTKPHDRRLREEAQIRRSTSSVEADDSAWLNESGRTMSTPSFSSSNRRASQELNTRHPQAMSTPCSQQQHLNNKAQRDDGLLSGFTPSTARSHRDPKHAAKMSSPKWEHALRLVNAIKQRRGEGEKGNTGDDVHSRNNNNNMSKKNNNANYKEREEEHLSYHRRHRSQERHHRSSGHQPLKAAAPTVKNSLDTRQKPTKDGGGANKLREALASALAEVITNTPDVPNGIAVADELLGELLSMDENSVEGSLEKAQEEGTYEEGEKESHCLTSASSLDKKHIISSIFSDTPLNFGIDATMSTWCPALERDIARALTLSQALSAVRRRQGELGSSGALVPISIQAILSVGMKVTRRRGAVAVIAATEERVREGMGSVTADEAVLLHDLSECSPRSAMIGGEEDRRHPSEGIQTCIDEEHRQQHDGSNTHTRVLRDVDVLTSQRELLREILSAVVLIDERRGGVEDRYAHVRLEYSSIEALVRLAFDDEALPSNDANTKAKLCGASFLEAFGKPTTSALTAAHGASSFPTKANTTTTTTTTNNTASSSSSKVVVANIMRQLMPHHPIHERFGGPTSAIKIAQSLRSKKERSSSSREHERERLEEREERAFRLFRRLADSSAAASEKDGHTKRFVSDSLSLPLLLALIKAMGDVNARHIAAELHGELRHALEIATRVVVSPLSAREACEHFVSLMTQIERGKDRQRRVRHSNATTSQRDVNPSGFRNNADDTKRKVWAAPRESGIEEEMGVVTFYVPPLHAAELVADAHRYAVGTCKSSPKSPNLALAIALYCSIGLYDFAAPLVGSYVKSTLHRSQLHSDVSHVLPTGLVSYIARKAEVNTAFHTAVSAMRRRRDKPLLDKPSFSSAASPSHRAEGALDLSEEIRNEDPFSTSSRFSLLTSNSSLVQVLEECCLCLIKGFQAHADDAEGGGTNGMRSVARQYGVELASAEAIIDIIISEEFPSLLALTMTDEERRVAGWCVEALVEWLLSDVAMASYAHAATLDEGLLMASVKRFQDAYELSRGNLSAGRMGRERSGSRGEVKYNHTSKGGNTQGKMTAEARLAPEASFALIRGTEGVNVRAYKGRVLTTRRIHMGKPIASLHRSRVASLLAAVFRRFPERFRHAWEAMMGSSLRSLSHESHGRGVFSLGKEAPALALMVSPWPYASIDRTLLTIAQCGFFTTSAAAVSTFLNALPESARPSPSETNLAIRTEKILTASKYSQVAGTKELLSSAVAPLLLPFFLLCKDRTTNSDLEASAVTNKDRSINSSSGRSVGVFEDKRGAVIQKSIDALVCVLSIRQSSPNYKARRWLNNCLFSSWDQHEKWGFLPTSIVSDAHCLRSILLSLALEAELAVAEEGPRGFIEDITKENHPSKGKGLRLASDTKTESEARFARHFLARVGDFVCFLERCQATAHQLPTNRSSVLCCAQCKPQQVRHLFERHSATPTTGPKWTDSGLLHMMRTSTVRDSSASQSNRRGAGGGPAAGALWIPSRNRNGLTSASASDDDDWLECEHELLLCGHVREMIDFIFKERVNEPGDKGLL